MRGDVPGMFAKIGGAMKGVTGEMVAEWERRGLVKTPPPPPGFVLSKPAKYRNVKTEIDGMQFDSKKEARRYLDLRAEQSDGTISELRCQVEFPLEVCDVVVCCYVADFTYIRDGVQIVEDVKSAVTKKNPAYRIKKKLFEAIYGIEIKEV